MKINTKPEHQDKNKLIRSMHIPVMVLFFIWVVFAVQELVHPELKGLGIIPRKAIGLWGILSAPFIHGGIEHIGSNTVSFFILLTSVFYFYPQIGIRVFWQSWLMVGLAVWLGARPSNHIGASGLVYAYASFLIFAGFSSRNKQLLSISLLVVFLYGSMVWGIFPIKEGISWESHLYGLVSGLVLAYVYLHKNRSKIFKKEPVRSDGPADHEYFRTNSLGIEQLAYIYIEDTEDSVSEK